MKKFLLSMTAFMLFAANTFAATIYLPTAGSSEYLPTVKIFAYSLSYDGSLIAEGYGSGTLITSTGVILTNNHVVENYNDPTVAYDAFQVCLTKSNEPETPICEFTASLITRDPAKDLALLKMDSKDVSGTSVDFDFYLSYQNASAYQIGETVTVIGYPDTGGKTITYTSGLISGVITEGGNRYIKTDADISFGNSGGTAVDEDGNFIGVPTYIIGSYSSEALGYFYPVEDAESWIETNKGEATLGNQTAEEKLKDEILAYVNANTKGVYKNDYPPYQISTIDGWKFGNSLEGAFEQTDYYYGSEALTIYPENRGDSSFLSVSVSAENFPYEINLEDVRSLRDYYSTSYLEGGLPSALEEVNFNGKYPALKEILYEYDWWTYGYYNMVNYYIPYGDYLITVSYSYLDSEVDRADEMEEIVATFSVDMSAIELSVVESVQSSDPMIKVTNPLDDAYLSDTSYEYDGVNYFGASFGKKDDYNFSASVLYELYWDETYTGDFEAFKQVKLEDAEAWYDIIAKGDLALDGHDGFFYIEQYDDYYSDSTTYYLDIFIEYDDNSYVVVYYTANEESYTKNLFAFRTILKNIELTNGGEGKYMLPSFVLTTSPLASGGKLSDIKNYVYEDNIKNLDSRSVFGEESPSIFNPAGAMARADFVMWAVKASDTLKVEFDEFMSGIVPLSFTDVDYESEASDYIEFAKEKGAVVGSQKSGKSYFSPNNQISLAAALKIVFALYGYEVWQAPSFIPWYVPYFQLGFKEGLIPYGVDDINYLLTRGEASFIIDTSSIPDYYYDDLWY